LIFLVVAQVRAGLTDLNVRTAEAIEQLKVFLNGDPFHITNEQIDLYIQRIMNFIEDDINVIISGVFSVGSTVGHLLAGILLAMFALIFVLLDGRMIWRWITGLLPRKARPAVDGG